MTIIFSIVILLFLIGSSFRKNGVSQNSVDYLDRVHTDFVKGFFILLVFLSHARGYYKFNSDFDTHYNVIQSFMSQGIVTFFLFSSGYGVLSALKTKKTYMNNFFKKRILNVIYEFQLAVLLFVLVQLFLLDKDLLISKVFYSMLAWDSIGNSNWYIFCIVVAYLFVYFIFSLIDFETLTEEKLKKGVLFVTILSLVYMLAMSQVKPYWWYDTILCFPLGMYYALYKERIDAFLNTHRSTFIAVMLSVLVAFVTYKFRTNIVIRVLFNLSFVLFFVFYLKLFSVKGKFLSYLGKNLFGIYILERIPMMYFKSISAFDNKYIYIIACFVVTIVLTELFNRMSLGIKNSFVKMISSHR